MLDRSGDKTVETSVSCTPLLMDFLRNETEDVSRTRTTELGSETVDPSSKDSQVRSFSRHRLRLRG